MVARDFEMALERIVPEDWGWQHVEEGEENAPTHIRASFMGPRVSGPLSGDGEGGESAPTHVRASLMGPSVIVPLSDGGTMALGTWQGIFFCEFDGPRER